MNRAQAQLQMMHQQRARIVAGDLHAGEDVLDTGSARAERLPDRPSPIGDEDYGGFLVVTNQQLIYHDKFGTTCVPWGVIASLKKHRMRGLMTSGMEVQFIDGSNWVFSGNTPFIKSLIRSFNRT